MKLPSGHIFVLKPGFELHPGMSLPTRLKCELCGLDIPASTLRLPEVRDKLIVPCPKAPSAVEENVVDRLAKEE